MSDQDDVQPDVALAAAGVVPVLSSSYNRTDMHRDFVRTFDSVEGRRVLGHLLAWSRLWENGLIGGLPASEALLISEGKRSIGQSLLSHMQGIIGKPDEEVIYGGRARNKRNG